MATGATSKLKIKGARPMDSGNYTCTMMGMKATTSVELNIQPGTVGENIIANIKIRNNICYPLKTVIFPILR
jgi:hypothetical protein